MDNGEKSAIPLDAIPARSSGYVDLRSYSAIGDGLTVALIAHDGSIDWYPTPLLDSPPAFARLLDAENGGCIELAPDGDFTVERAYIPRTNVLQTTYTTATGSARVTDSLNTGLSGRLPWGELARRIEGLEGEVAMRWRVAPGTALASASPWAHSSPLGPVLRIGDTTVGVRGTAIGDSVVTGRDISGTFTARRSSHHLLGILTTSAEPLQLPDPEDIDRGIDRTVRYWESWSAELRYEGPWSDEVLRSALALKLLHSPSGAIAAAATTSLPESLDGGKNWDYRFAWVRDAAYTLHTLIRFGEREEVHAALSWLLRVARDRGADLAVFTRLDGGEPDAERAVDVPGWRRIGPVVTGNRAKGQLQLGIYGDLFEMVRLYVEGGHLLDTDTTRLLSEMADRTCDVWQRADAGIWELQTDRHYTSSKMGCWHALECAVALAEEGHIEGSVERWRYERDRIRDWIDEHCWSETLQSYTWYSGTDQLDASVLLHAASGFDRGPRMSSTIDAVTRELGDGPLIYRYSGADEEEGTFVACAFWAVAALVEVGRRREAEELMGRLVPLANDVGLYSEMIASRDHSFLGNLPQGLSHLALMAAALTLVEEY
ncbi:glycoside hydrolase family 15 protein [Leucobacter chromiisoli]|uniref:glycoside hydrolase family 15 protein n=1 Tax=Leucobacter chromiisoli TaxID=2796471 RepID=UPI0027DC72EF|nr:glycoside hydrolase family 15 protein [Leucobacter chromiisoli]